MINDDSVVALISDTPPAEMLQDAEGDVVLALLVIVKGEDEEVEIRVTSEQGDEWTEHNLEVAQRALARWISAL